MESPVEKKLLVVRPAKALFYFFGSIFLIFSTVILLSEQALSSKLEIICILAVPTFVLLYSGWKKNIITLTNLDLTLVSLGTKGHVRSSRTVTVVTSDIRLVEVDTNAFVVTDVANNQYMMRMGVFMKSSIVTLIDALKQQGVNVITHF